MKKLMVGLLFAGLAALVGVLGYLVFDTMQNPAPAIQPVPAASSSQASASQASPGASEVRVNVMRELKTDADILDAIAYEKGQNKDTVGWLSVPGTRINASVLQSFDNAYYLRRNERRQEEQYGCYFADFTCNFGSREELSPNTVIYGHSDLKDSKDGAKFSELFRFTEQDFAERYPVIRFSTDESPMQWQIFAVFYTDLKLDFTKASLTPDEIETMAAAFRERSLYHYDVPVTGEDKLLTLVTCTVKYGQEQKDQRFVVAAKLVPEGEEAPTRAVLEGNPEPKQPEFD